MNLILLMIMMALFLGICFLVAFFWTVRSGQMDELDSPAVRMLVDHELERKKQ